MKLYKSFATVGGLTLLSRVFGFLRDILIAATLGSGWVADAFVVAFRFPNLFRRLFGEGRVQFGVRADLCQKSSKVKDAMRRAASPKTRWRVCCSFC